MAPQKLELALQLCLFSIAQRGVYVRVRFPVGPHAKFRLLPDLPILGSTPFSCKFTYCFCAHMHEIVKYFILTEIQEQYLYFPEI